MESKRSQQLDDQALLRRFRENPGTHAAREAASELFRRYQGRVYQWCFRYAGEYETALDMAQDVMLNAYRNLGTFGGRARFSSWLYAITRYRCVSALRRPTLDTAGQHDPDLLADPRSRPDREIEETQEKEALLELMRKNLNRREQEALCLQLFEQMSVDSITQALGIEGKAGARSVLQSARRKLRAALTRSPQSPGDVPHV
jgi:RNA polymerase sigma-70 factor (ECF subfamily)